jgi:predicted ATPase/class 3 adenylate cyclase
MRRDLPAGTVTFLFTDVEGSTKLLHELGAGAYAAKLAEHRSVVREACTARGGVEVDTQGDAFFIAFPNAPAALDAARAIAEALASGPITLRIGVHTGTPLVTEEGYVGEDVHFAARVAASAHGGQVVLSRTTQALVDERYELVELGEHRLKDIPEPVAIFQLGDRQFPPLKTISNTNLPRPASSFLGREKELREVLTTIERGARLLTLTGPGGSGKTRLALEAAATLVPEYKAGAFWVGLASLRDAALVSEQIAHTLGAKNGLVEHIGEREMLLLLDNLEHVIDSAPELSALLQSCPNLTLLCTSRELLRVQGEVEYPVPPLNEAEAVSLFCERAQTMASEQIVELCRRLDNLPLAVELAAARTKALSAEEILERLSRRLDLLKGARDADPRHQTLRATIEWSYDLLAQEEQRLLRALSIFAGGCTLEAAQEVADAELDTLQSLVEKSLLRFSASAAGARYWMLETIRGYAAERLAEASTKAELEERHATWYARVIEQAEPHLETAAGDVWLDRCEAEHANIRAALRSAMNRRRGDLALWLAGSTAAFWWVRGYWSEGLRWLEEALAQPAPHGLLQRAKALEGAAHLAARLRRFEAAKSLAEECLAIGETLQDAKTTGRALRVLSLVAAGEGDRDRFLELVDLSATFARQAEDSWTLSMALNNLGYVELGAGRLQQASSLFEEALELARGRGDQRSECLFLENSGFALLERGLVEQAREAFRDSLRVAHRLRYLEMIVEDLIGLAAVASTTGDLERAACLLGGAEHLREGLGATGLDPVEGRIQAKVVAQIEQKLEPTSRQAALRSGRMLDRDQLVELGLTP